jgi:hypothetical protein
VQQLAHRRRFERRQRQVVGAAGKARGRRGCRSARRRRCRRAPGRSPAGSRRGPLWPAARPR